MVNPEFYTAPRVVALEDRIINARNVPKDTLEEWFEERAALLDENFVLSDENVRLLAEANQAMRNVLVAMRRRAYELYERTNLLPLTGERYEVSGSCHLIGAIPALHPLPSQHLEDFYAVFAFNSRWCMAGGIHGFDLSLPRDLDQKDDDFLTLGCCNCWNEGLDRELTKGMGLIHSVHHLHNMAHFSWLDIILLRESDFATKINVSYERY